MINGNSLETPVNVCYSGILMFIKCKAVEFEISGVKVYNTLIHTG